jgi:hypothetical protein
MEYMLVQESETAMFESLIDDSLEEGWVLYGNVVVIIDADGVQHLYQAMTRELDKE